MQIINLRNDSELYGDFGHLIDIPADYTDIPEVSSSDDKAVESDVASATTKPQVSTGPPPAIHLALIPEATQSNQRRVRSRSTKYQFTVPAKNTNKYEDAEKPVVAAGVPRLLPFPKFVHEYLAEHRVVKRKDFAAGVFIGKPTNAGVEKVKGWDGKTRKVQFRRKADLWGVGMLALDIDGGNIEYGPVVDRLYELNVQFATYTSINHGKLDDSGHVLHKFRVFVPLDAVIAKSKLEAATWGLCELLSIDPDSVGLDTVSSRGIQYYYLPSVLESGTVGDLEHEIDYQLDGPVLDGGALVATGAAMRSDAGESNTAAAKAALEDTAAEKLAVRREALLYRAWSEKFPECISNGGEGKKAYLEGPCPYEHLHSGDNKRDTLFRYHLWTEDGKQAGGGECVHTNHDGIGKVDGVKFRQELGISLDDWKAVTVGAGAAGLAGLLENYAYVEAQAKWYKTGCGLVAPEAVNAVNYGTTGDVKPVVAMLASGDATVVWNTGWAPVPYGESIQRTYTEYDNTVRANTYTHPQLEPIAGDASRFLELAEYLIPDEQDRLTVVSWMAMLLQYPDIKIRWQLMIWGLARCGKDTLFAALQHTLGGGYTDIKPEEMSSWGNYRAGKKLIVMQEVYQPQNVKFYNDMKAELGGTAARLAWFNPKSEKMVEYRALAQYVLMSNHSDALKLPEDDGKLFVVNVAPTPKTIWSGEKLKAYHHWLEKEDGAAIVMNYLLNEVDVSSFSWQSLPYVTDDYTAMMIEGEAAWRKMVKAQYDIKGWPFNIPVVLVRDIMHFVRTESGRAMDANNTTVPALLREMGFVKAPRMRLRGGRPPELPAGYCFKADYKKLSQKSGKELHNEFCDSFDDGREAYNHQPW